MIWGALQGADTQAVSIRLIGEGREHLVEI